MNEAHLQACASPEWRQFVEEVLLPTALGESDLGDDVVEVGPGPGFTTDVLRTRCAHLTAVEIDAELAGSLAARLDATNVSVVQADAAHLDLDDGRFSAAVSFNMLHHVATAAHQDSVFAELGRVVRPGGVLIAADGVANDGTRAFHEGDTYNPIDPASLPRRLASAGFGDVAVQVADLLWYCSARRAG